MNTVALRLLQMMVLCLSALATSCGNVKVNDRQCELCGRYALVDSMLSNATEELELAQWRIASLQKRITLSDDDNDLFDYRKQIVEEFVTLDMDSAISYSELNMALAHRLHRPDRLGEIYLRRSYVYTVWDECQLAKRELAKAEKLMEFDDLKVQYLFQKLFIALRCGQTSEDEVADTAAKLQTLLKGDDLANMMLWSRFFNTTGVDERRNLRREIESRMIELQPDGVWTGHLGYLAALLAQEEGDDSRAADRMCDVALSLGSRIRVYAPALKVIASQACCDGDSLHGNSIMEYYKSL